MNPKLAGLAILLAASMAVPCVAQQSPGKKSPKGPAAHTGGVTIKPSAPVAPAPPAIGNVEEGQKVAEIQAILAAGEFDKAIEAANTFLKTARDEGAKTEAFRILAEAYRKKGDWRQAAAAYQRLSERFAKDSDDAIKYTGIADILRGSPVGVYLPPGSPAAKAPTAAGQTLADDAVLAEALIKLAAFHGSRIKTRIGVITRGTTPQLVVAALMPVAEESRQIFCLSSDAPADVPREVCTAVGNRLQTLGTQISAVLKNNLDRLRPKMRDYAGTITTVEKTEVTNTKIACREMAEAESKFQQALPVMSGKGNWPDQARLRRESDERRASYEQLGSQFFIPKAAGGYYGGDYYW